MLLNMYLGSRPYTPMSPRGFTYLSTCTKTLGPMARNSRRSSYVWCIMVYGDCMTIAECGVLLPGHATVNVNSPLINHGRLLLAGMHRTVAARIRPTQCVGAGTLERHPHFKTALVDLFTDTIASLVIPQPLDAKTTDNHYRLYGCFKRDDGVELRLRQSGLCRLRVLVGHLDEGACSPRVPMEVRDPSGL